MAVPVLVHVVASPFPLRVNGGLVTDERCRCGHERSGHFDSRTADKGGAWVAYGHGECSVSPCRCVKFTWAAFLGCDGGAR